MSGSTQSTGTNYMRRSITGSSAITICGWLKMNSYSKGPSFADAVFVFSSFALDGVSFRGVYLEQDADGPGTGLFLSSAAFISGSYNSGSTAPKSAPGQWMFFAFVINGATNAAVDVYYGTENGPLSHAAWATTIPATTLHHFQLGSDAAPGSSGASDVSFRGVRTWLAALSSSEILLERSSASFAPVRTSNLDSDIRIPNGTNPGTATSGGNWTLTGSFSADPGDPFFGDALMVGNPSLIL